MDVNDLHATGEEVPVVTIIQQLKDSSLDPKMLPKETRQQCVEVCILEGYSVSQITQLFHCSEKTVRRDIADIRVKNALAPNLELVKQLIGELYSKGINHHGYLMRLARSKEAAISEKIQAEYAAWKVLKDLSEKLQSLGYLPLKPQEIVGDIFHHTDEQNLDKTFQDVRKALTDVIDVAQQCGTLTPELQENVNLLRQRVEKVEIIKDAGKLLKSSNEPEEENHDQQNS